MHCITGIRCGTCTNCRNNFYLIQTFPIRPVPIRSFYDRHKELSSVVEIWKQSMLCINCDPGYKGLDYRFSNSRIHREAACRTCGVPICAERRFMSIKIKIRGQPASVLQPVDPAAYRWITTPYCSEHIHEARKLREQTEVREFSL